MSGQTVDSNSSMIANFLGPKGYVIKRKVTIDDDLDDLCHEIEQISSNSDVLIINGGLGPTIDDLTAQALGIVTKRELTANTEALAHLETMAQNIGIQLNEANLKQTILPDGVDVIPNPVGTAVGFSIQHNNCTIFCTPGVPSELRVMMADQVMPAISAKFPNRSDVRTLRFQTFGIGESDLQQCISNDYGDWPKEVELGFRAGMPLLEIKLIIQSVQHLAVQQQCYQRLKSLIGDYIVGEDSTTLAESVHQLLLQRQQKITTAESCTGGLIASSLTEVPGVSSVFEAGMVTYSNRIKQQFLSIDPQYFSDGAVSEPVAIAMAKGAIAKTNADYAIAVSGIAGPDGGSDEKPVGTVWIAWGADDDISTKALLIKRPRVSFQKMVTAISLDLIRRQLSGIKAEPRYFQRLAVRK